MSKKDRLYSQPYREFNSTGDRLNTLIFEGREPIANVAVVLITHSMFTGMPTIDAAKNICGAYSQLHLVFKDSSQNDDFEAYVRSKGIKCLKSRK
ncbi:MAG: hypothetical protein ACK5BE_04065 [Alphaproteobacteria bacterium]|jgi:hypothetical protein